MDRGWYFRFLILVVAVASAVLALWPSVDAWFPAPAIVKKVFPGRISPGLDIKGGLRLMYEVEVDEYIRDRRDRQATRMIPKLGVELGMLDEDEEDSATRQKLEQIKSRVTVERLQGRRIRVEFAKDSDSKKVSSEWFREAFAELRVTEREGTRVELTMREEQLDELRDTAVQQAVRTVGDRIDTMGLREATVIGRDNDLIVEIPGADESMFDRIRAIISRTARLEFKILDDESSFIADLKDLPEGIEKESEAAPAGETKPNVRVDYLVARGEGARQRLSDYIENLDLPDDHQLILNELTAADDPGAERKASDEAWRTFYVFRTTDVTGEDIEDAFVSFDPQEGNRPVVSLQFNSDGAGKFEELTGRNVKRRMAIVLDDRAESAPVIQTRIGGGRAQITLGSYRDYNQLLGEANDLVVVLRAGALPAPLRPSNEQLIGPTLGRDSVKKGAQGAVIGVLLVLLFMAIYYQVAGLVADVMVVLNVLFLLAIMAAFEATLTLPGVAAIALTVGMAVDANVLITERIREELRLGKPPRSAVEQGFGRAFWSVFDSQLTTFIAGVVLFQYGTGPIKGFAVMLMIGIATSLFTGIFCSRVLLDGLVRGLKLQRLRVG